MRRLNKEPKWESEDFKVLHLKSGVEIHRFTGSNGEVFVFAIAPEVKNSGDWYEIPPALWNEFVDSHRVEEISGLEGGIYLKEPSALHD